MSAHPPRTSLQRVTAVLHRSGMTAAFVRIAGRGRHQPVFAILSYHRVNDAADPFFTSLPTEVFERQMAHVARHYCVLTVEELAERMRRRDIPRNALAITFDDGYRDNLTHAAPILARHGLRATVFLATQFIGAAEVPWYDRLAMAFKLTKQTAVTVGGGPVLRLDGPAGCFAGMEQVRGQLKRMPEDRRRRVLDELLEQLGVAAERSVKNAMLTWDDVHALAGLGFSVGAHTMSHPILSQVTPVQAGREILGSKAAIAAVLGAPPRAFAYPNGGPEDYTAEVVKAVRQAGFTCAVTTRFGVNSAATSPWELRRGGPWEYDLPTFALKLAWYRLTLS